MRVLITGTSTGIGLATAVELGRAGHTVFGTMRNPGRAPQLGEIVAQERLPVSILTMDEFRALVYENGTMSDLNSLIDPTLGITLSSAVGINNGGQIIAVNQNGSTFQGYLLAPIPQARPVVPPAPPGPVPFR